MGGLDSHVVVVELNEDEINIDIADGVSLVFLYWLLVVGGSALVRIVW